MNDNFKKLLEKVKDNPDLPIIPLVDGEVCVNDGNAYYMAEWGISEVGEYTEYNERVYFNRDEFEEDYYDYNDDFLRAEFGYDPRMSYGDKSKYTLEQLEANNIAKKKLNDYLAAESEARFKKAILVYITTLSD